MIRLTIGTVLGAIAAGVVAWKLGGALGGGVLAGFGLGAGISGLGAMYQRHILLTQPQRSLQAVSISFLAKLAALLIGALAFRYIEAAGQRADWRSFLVAFAVAVLIVLPLGTLDAAKAVRRRSESAGSPGGNGSSGRTGVSEGNGI
jgi:hypothetical protein